MSLVQYIHQPAATNSIFDLAGLSNLKRGVSAGANAPLAQQKKVAHQFEALFIQQFLKQARQASMMSGPFDSDQTRMAQSMADQQLATQLATPGIGLARALLQQIQAGRSQNDPGADADTSQVIAPSSRVAGLSSQVGPDESGKIPSISALISMLGGNSISGAVVNAVKEAPQYIHDFVSKMSGAAKVASSQTGVPAKLILSQAALESGWGTRQIRGDDGKNSYNLFGIKATPDWTGKVVNVTTTEYVDGAPQKVVQPFRAYDSYAESFADYAKLIGQSPRYSSVLKAASAEDAAQKIQAAGYATDPNYAQKLISIMGHFNQAGQASI